jgi:hypothetical protein
MRQFQSYSTYYIFCLKKDFIFADIKKENLLYVHRDSEKSMTTLRTSIDLQLTLLKKRDFIKSCSYIHSLACIVVGYIGGQIREIVGSTRQGVGRYRVGMKLYFRFSRVFFGRKSKNYENKFHYIRSYEFH